MKVRALLVVLLLVGCTPGDDGFSFAAAEPTPVLSVTVGAELVPIRVSRFQTVDPSLRTDGLPYQLVKARAAHGDGEVRITRGFEFPAVAAEVSATIYHDSVHNPALVLVQRPGESWQLVPCDKGVWSLADITSTGTSTVLRVSGRGQGVEEPIDAAALGWHSNDLDLPIGTRIRLVPVPIGQFWRNLGATEDLELIYFRQAR